MRVIATTNVDLEEAVREKAFREDLYYRLNVIRFDLPPLRERKEDIPLLACHFLKKHTESAGKPFQGISEEALKRMLVYSWPGNVRELENALERAVAVGKGPVVRPEDLPESLGRREESLDFLEAVAERGLTVEELEREYILKALEQVVWIRPGQPRPWAWTGPPSIGSWSSMGRPRRLRSFAFSLPNSPLRSMREEVVWIRPDARMILETHAKWLLGVHSADRLSYPFDLFIP